MTVRGLLKPGALLTIVAITSGLAVAYSGGHTMIAFIVLACVVLLSGFLLFRRRHALVNSLRLFPATSARERKRPSLFTEILFLLLLSGPPMFRSRDPLASIRGQIDAVVIFQLLVWGLAGIWVLLPLIGRQLSNGQCAQLQLPQKLGLALVVCLGISVVVSPGPAFTVFKVYQMAVSLLFGFVFVNRYGVESCLRRLLLGYTILCVGAVIAAFIAPDILLYGRAHSGFFRLRGDLFVMVGTVAVFALALLLANPPRVPLPVIAIMFGLFFTLLVLSETRTAYVTMFVFMILAIIRWPKITTLRRFLYIIPAATVVLFLTGFMPSITKWIIRNPASIPDIGGRLELWTYLLNVTLKKSPWIGLGYASAGRVLSLDFASNYGNSHSAFISILVGGGILSMVFLVLLVCALIVDAAAIFYRNNNRFSFAASSLLPLVLLMAAGGWGYFDAGPVALTFWCLAAMLPSLRDRTLKCRSKRNKVWRISEIPRHPQTSLTT